MQMKGPASGGKFEKQMLNIISKSLFWQLYTKGAKR
jgi:hypothetical protein